MNKSKRVLGMLAFTAVLAGGNTVMAASGEAMFADVPSGHWAYSAVAELKADGLIKGTGANRFDGETVVTRYQMAQLVASAVAYRDQASGSEKAEIDKLSQEFSDELKSLKSLGRRVEALEQQQKKVESNFKISGNLEVSTEDHWKTGSGKQSRWWAKVLYLNTEAKLPKIAGDWKFHSTYETKFGSDRFDEEPMLTQYFNGGDARKSMMRPSEFYFSGSLPQLGWFARVGLFTPWTQSGFVNGGQVQGVMLEKWGKNFAWHVYGGRLDSEDSELGLAVTPVGDLNASSGRLGQEYNDNVRAHEINYWVKDAAGKIHLSKDGKTALSVSEAQHYLDNGGTGSDNSYDANDLYNVWGAGNKRTPKTVYGWALDKTFNRRLNGSIGAYRYTSAAYNQKPLYLGSVTMEYKLMPKVAIRGIYSQGNQHGMGSNARGGLIDIMWNCSPWMAADKAHKFGAFLGWHYLAPDAYIRCGYNDGVAKGQKGVVVGTYYNLTSNMQVSFKYGVGRSLTFTGNNKKRDKFQGALYAYF